MSTKPDPFGSTVPVPEITPSFDPLQFPSPPPDGPLISAPPIDIPEQPFDPPDGPEAPDPEDVPEMPEIEVIGQADQSDAGTDSGVAGGGDGVPDVAGADVGGGDAGGGDGGGGDGGGGGGE